MHRLLIAFALMAMSAPPALAAPSAARDTKCLWERLPVAEREAIVLGYAATGPEALTFTDPVLDSIIANERACGFPDERAAAGALTGYAMWTAAANRLETRFKVRPGELDAAWQGVDASAKRRYVDSQADEGEPSPADDEAHNAVFRGILSKVVTREMITDGVFSKDAQADVHYYGQGRAIQQANEGPR